MITTGTFLRGRIHIGTTTTIAGGRAGRGAGDASRRAARARRARGRALQDRHAAAHRRPVGATATRSSARRARSSSSTTRGRTSGRRRAVRRRRDAPSGAAARAGSPSSARTGKQIIAENIARVGDVRRRDRVARPALLPVGRGQDRQVPRRRAAPALPRARGARHARAVRERAVDVAAGAGAARGAAHRARARARAR